MVREFASEGMVSYIAPKCESDTYVSLLSGHCFLSMRLTQHNQSSQ